MLTAKHLFLRFVLLLLFFSPCSAKAVDIYPDRNEEAVLLRNVADLLSEGLSEYDESFLTPSWINGYALRLALRAYPRELRERMAHSDYGFEGQDKVWRYALPLDVVRSIARDFFDAELVAENTNQAKLAGKYYYFKARPESGGQWAVVMRQPPVHFHNGCCHYFLTAIAPDGQRSQWIAVICPSKDDSRWLVAGFSREQ